MQDPPLPVTELVVLALLLGAAAWRWWNRDALRPPPEVAEALREPLAALRSEPISSASGSPLPSSDRARAAAIARFSPGLSEPLLLELTERLVLLGRAGAARVTPLLGEAVAEALARTAPGGPGAGGAEELPPALSWPCQLHADERWVLVDVELWSAEEDGAWRRRRLRLRRATEEPAGSLLDALERLRSLDGSPLSTAEVGGFTLAALLDEERLPAGAELLRRLRRASPSPEGEEGLHERGAGEGEAARLVGRIQDLLPLSLAARGVEGGALPLAGERVLRQHAFLRRLVPFVRPPDGGRVRELAFGEDRHFRLAWAEVEVRAGAERQVERWCLGCPHERPEQGWSWLDLRHPALFPAG